MSSFLYAESVYATRNEKLFKGITLILKKELLLIRSGESYKFIDTSVRFFWMVKEISFFQLAVSFFFKASSKPWAVSSLSVSTLGCFGSLTIFAHLCASSTPQLYFAGKWKLVWNSSKRVAYKVLARASLRATTQLFKRFIPQDNSRVYWQFIISDPILLLLGL